MRSSKIALALAVCAAVLIAAPSASAWSRTVNLGAATISGDSTHRLLGTVSWQMPDAWTTTITEGDSGGFRFWPSTIGPGCTALASFSFRPIHSRQSQAKRLAAISKPLSGGRLISSGSRIGGAYAIVRNSIMAAGLPVFPGAYYIDAAGLVKAGNTTWLDLAFYAYTSGSCTVSMVESSGLIGAAQAFVRDSNFALRVAGKWPAGA